MANITITEEQACRARIVADVTGIGPLAGKVFNRRRSISSRKDFFAKLGNDVDDKTEIRYIEIELLNIEDSETEGFDDCPVAVLTYNLHLFHEFADLRSDNSNSDKDFTELLLLLRTFFLGEQEFTITGWEIQTQPLIFSEFTQFGNDTFTDVRGHWKDLTLKANFYDI